MDTRVAARRWAIAFGATAFVLWYGGMYLVSGKRLVRWFFGDPAFSIYLPLIYPFVIYYLVQNLSGRKGLLSIAARRFRHARWLASAYMIVMLVMLVPTTLSDARRPTAPQDYMIKDDASGGSSVWQQADEVRSLGIAFSARTWPKVAGGAAGTVPSEYRSLAAMASDDSTRCDAFAPSEESKVWVAGACQFARDWQITQAPQFPSSRYTHMPLVNLVLNYLAFAVAAAALLHFFLLFRYAGNEEAKPILWRAVAILVLLAAWLPIRLYSEFFINFLAPKVYEPESYQALTIAAMSLAMVSVFVAIKLAELKFSKETVVSVLQAVLVTLGAMVAARPEAVYGTIHWIASLESSFACMATAIVLVGLFVFVGYVASFGGQGGEEGSAVRIRLNIRA